MEELGTGDGGIRYWGWGDWRNEVPRMGRMEELGTGDVGEWKKMRN